MFGFGVNRNRRLRIGGGSALITNGIIHDVDNDSDGGDIPNTLLAINGGELDRNASTLLAMIVTSANDGSAPMVRAQLDAFGYTGVPVGATVSLTGLPTTFTTRSFVNGNPADAANFAIPTTTAFRPGDTRTNYPTEVSVYKAALARCADGTAKIAVTGGMTSIARLLADTEGKALLTQKCAAIYVMGARFDGVALNEANIATDIPSAQYFIANMPTSIPVYWTGFETGTAINAYVPNDIGLSAATDPSKKGWDTFGGNNSTGTPIWDYLATHNALYGAGTDSINGGALFAYSSPVDVSFDASGVATFSANASAQHRYMTNVAPTAIIQSELQKHVYEIYARRTAGWVANAPNGYRGLIEAEYRLTEGTGATAADNSGNGRTMTLGSTGGVDTNDPAWTSTGLLFDGTTDYASVPHNAAFNRRELFMWAVIRYTGVNTIQIIMSRDDGSANRVFHLRINAANQLEFVGFNGAAVTVTGTEQTLTVNTWYLVSAQINSDLAILRVGNTIVGKARMTGFPSNSLNYTATQALQIGGRNNGATNPFKGDIATLGYMRCPPEANLPALFADIRAVATAKGIAGI